jgi:tRNA (cytosine38-C5)-methyltransferase
MSSTTPLKRRREPEHQPESDEKTADPDAQVLRYLEFYAGVGGWRLALEEAVRAAGLATECVGALDHSDLCLQVYHHNFPTHRKLKSCRIEQIKVAQLQREWRADIWMMSPPCQPHTRQHENQTADLVDPRSSSFLHICKLLGELPLDALPTIIALENVVGFAESNSCRSWRETLAKRDYLVTHFHWNPTQVNLPNDRPRYFSLAVLRNKTVRHSALANILMSERVEEHPIIRTHLSTLDVVEGSASDLPPIQGFLDPSDTADRTVPQKLLERNAAWCFDVVTPESRRSACFTSGYGRFVKGTGSVLYTDPERSENLFALENPEDRTFEADWAKNLSTGSLRYFSGLEIARLMGFPPSFGFPPTCSTKQQWKLMGNSLNVRLAARLLTLGLSLAGKLSLEVVKQNGSKA